MLFLNPETHSLGVVVGWFGALVVLCKNWPNSFTSVELEHACDTLLKSNGFGVYVFAKVSSQALFDFQR
jgi:hypothetical protein